jgi:biopolymer transport protein ExbD
MSSKRRSHGKKKPEVEINITAFMNLMVVLVPFLLMTAVFTQLVVLELNLPTADSGKNDKNNKPTFELQVTIRQDALVLADNKGGLIKSIPKTDQGHNYAVLRKVLKQVKARFPDKTNATILSEPDTEYNTLVQVMDSVRMYRAFLDGEWIEAELFPDMSLGDATPLK